MPDTHHGVNMATSVFFRLSDVKSTLLCYYLLPSLFSCFMTLSSAISPTSLFTSQSLDLNRLVSPALTRLCLQPPGLPFLGPSLRVCFHGTGAVPGGSVTGQI